MEQTSPIRLALDDNISPFARVARPKWRFCGPVYALGARGPSERDEYVSLREHSYDAESGRRIAAADIPDAIGNRTEPAHVRGFGCKGRETDGEFRTLDEIFEVSA